MRRTPASTGQRLLWFLDRHSGDGGALNCPMACRLTGPVDTAAVAGAIGRLAARHESLRTTFTGAGRGLTQVIHEPGALPVRRVNLTGQATAEDALSIELGTRVDPVTWPVRATLWRVDPLDHVLCLNMHHLITDTWSCDVLLREFALCYSSAVGNAAALPPVGWQYRQFVLWQERQFKRPDFSRHRDYWRTQLTAVGPLKLPIDARSAADRGQLSETVWISDSVGAKLRQLGQANGTTIFAVMLAVYYCLLHRMTGSDDLAVSSLFANRTRPEVQNTVGFLANLLVLRVQLQPGATFADITSIARRIVIDAAAHQELPFHLVPQTTAGSGLLRLDDVVFQMLAHPLDDRISVGEMEVRGIVPDLAGRFDFELALMPRAQGFAVKLFYNKDRVDVGWARMFIANYAALAAAVAAAPDMPVNALKP